MTTRLYLLQELYQGAEKMADIDVIDEVKKRLGDFGVETDESDYSLLRHLKESCDELIRSSVGYNEIPEGLFYARVDWICGELLIYKRSLGLLDDNAPVKIKRSVKKIQEGDVTVEYGEGGDEQEETSELIGRLKDRLGKELVNYRCIKWK